MIEDAKPYVDCRRLGLRCVACLPRGQWCDLCTERHPLTVYLPNEPWPWSYVCLGWAGIVNRLATDLDEAAPGWRVSQIKEKFGGLRFGVVLLEATPEQEAAVGTLISAAETASFTICDVCGEPGTRRSLGGWARTRCGQHRDVVPRDLADPEAFLAEIEFPPGEQYRK